MSLAGGGRQFIAALAISGGLWLTASCDEDDSTVSGGDGPGSDGEGEGPTAEGEGEGAATEGEGEDGSEGEGPAAEGEGEGPPTEGEGERGEGEGEGEACRSPSREVCDSLDNDCDGETDEEQDLERSGSIGLRCGATIGACVEGVSACELGVTVCAGAIMPRAELCDGADDDCDGETDEDFPGLGQPCSVGVGACLTRGLLHCTDEGRALCGTGPAEPSADGCDGADNDCDGETDEDVDGPCPREVVSTAEALHIPPGVTHRLTGEHCFRGHVRIEGTLVVAPEPGQRGVGLTLRAPRISLAESGSIVADGAGHPGGATAERNGGHQGSGDGGGCGGGRGDRSANAGSGGGHGGRGGTGPHTEFAGECRECDNPFNPAHCWGAGGRVHGAADGTDLGPGSGGGSAGNSHGCLANGAPGGAGGGRILLQGEEVTLDGSISADGATPALDVDECGFHQGGGGGSGGGVIVRAAWLLGGGFVRARGGNGGDSTGSNGTFGWGGGGGGGGRIKLLAGVNSFDGNLDVSGGAGGDAPDPEGESWNFDGLPGERGSSLLAGLEEPALADPSCP